MDEKAAVGASGGLRILVTALVASALVGGFAGYAMGTMAPAAPVTGNQAPQERTFIVVSTVLNFDDATIGIPHDAFYPDMITVKQGDTVTIIFYNTEDADETHDFVIGAPYNIDLEVPFGQHDSVTFVASEAGVFPYLCSYHQPTMSGELVVFS